MSNSERIAQLEDQLARQRRSSTQEHDRLVEEVRIHRVRAEQFKRERDALQTQLDSRAK